MDPLSISASIAGLVTLADLVFRSAAKYAKGVTGSRKEVEALSREVKNLSLVLHHLSLIAFDLESQTAAGGTAPEQASHFKAHHLHDCQQVLRRLEKALCDTKSGLESGSRLDRLQRSLKWPFSSTETTELLQELQRHKQTIDLALAAESLSKLKLSLSRQAEVNDGIKKVQLSVEQLLDMQTKQDLDRNQDEVLSAFTKVNPRPEFDTNRKLRHHLTGLWFTEGSDFEDWYTTPGSKIWCSGIPGAGKSVLAAAIIEECLTRNGPNPGPAVAYFFCTYRDPRTQDPATILSSLCAQLASQNKDAFRILKGYYDELRSNRHFPADPSVARLIEVVQDMRTSFTQVYLVVDGLDECGDHVETSVEILVDLASSSNDDTINLALLSRDETPIRERVDPGFRNIEIEAHTDDVQHYVTTELDQRISSKKLRLRDLGLKDQIMTRLVSGAKGMFRWVACQLDHICELPTDRARREALDQLPPTLPATYERILTRIDGKNEESKRFVRATILLISAPDPERLSFAQVCEAASLRDNSDSLYEDEVVEEAEILRLCGSLVRTSKDGKFIEFAHFSVQEYLEGDCLKHPTLSDYGVSPTRRHNALAPLCLRFLTLKNHERLPEATESEVDRILERRQNRPFYEHAAIYWPHYANSSSSTSSLESHDSDHLDGLFHLPKTPSFCAWATELTRHCLALEGRLIISFNEHDGFGKNKREAIEVITAVLRPDFTPLHMAAALGMPDLCRRLLEKGANVVLRSRFGTPFHCAIGSLNVFCNQEQSAYWLSPPGFWPPLARRRRQTVQLLLEAGANPELRLTTPFHTTTPLSLAILAKLGKQAGPEDIETAADLIRLGVRVEEEDHEAFRGFLGFDDSLDCKSIFGDGDALRNLLESLADHDSVTPTPKSRLYAQTLEVFQRRKIRLPTKLLRPAPADDSNDTASLQFLHLLIKTNDTPGIGQYLAGHRADLVKAAGIDPDKPDWTSLHLAVHYKSLDVLNVLLDYGVGAEIPDKDGKTPVHLCCSDEDHQDGDSLRALLQHGVSTVVTDKHQMTIWHYGAMNGSTEVLGVLVDLVESDERERALKMVSSQNETPICAALAEGSEQCVSLLLDFCRSEIYWKSAKSMFRGAAQIGSSDVIQCLLDAGIEADGMDSDSGSPLHFLSLRPTLECVNMLKQLYPVDQRRKRDRRTPLELMLLEAARAEVELDSEVLAALLPSTTTSNPCEASALWSFACSEFTLLATNPHRMWNFHRGSFSFLVEVGIAKLFEEERTESAILPFLAIIAKKAPEMYEALANGPIQPVPLFYWYSFSKIALRIARETKYWASVIRDPNIIRLLSLAIFHDDQPMMTFLVENGVSIHSRMDKLSPFDFACLPQVPIGEVGFDHLLAHATQQEMTQGNESFGGRGPLHFTAGLQFKGVGSILKLRRLLETGIDGNLPISATSGSPVAYHAHQGASNTAELLLDFGADPWAAGSQFPDAAFESIYQGNLSLLTKIMTMPSDGSHPPRWGRTCTSSIDEKPFSGGSALHWAAAFGRLECLKFYLDQNLLSDLDMGDDNLETPMHYAAQFGHSATIEFLVARGGNIDAPNRSGLTPLHLAVRSRQLGVVETLTSHGAKHQVCHAGCTPLQYAYASGHSGIIEALGTASSKTLTRDETSIASPQKQRALADGFLMAIGRDDVAACERIHALGCSVDAELNHSECATPLALAIRKKTSLKVVEWLFDNGATVSAIFPRLVGGHSTVVEEAVTTAKYNSILPRLVKRYVEEGGDVLGMHHNPLRCAIESGNGEGFAILLDTIREICGRKVDPSVASVDLPQPNIFSAFVNRREAAYDHCTALHVAAKLNHCDATVALIKYGADIEEGDFHQVTPLHYAAAHGSLEVAKHLLRSGARVDALNESGQTPFMVTLILGKWKLAELLTEASQSSIRTDLAGRNALHLMTQFEGQGGRTSHVHIFHRLLDQGLDIHQVDALGQSAVHWMLASHSAIYLRSLLNNDARLLRAQQIAGWPDFLVSGSRNFKTSKLVAITKNLRLVRSFVSECELHHLAGLANPGSHSLLCQAARQGNVQAIQNLAILGMDMMEHECHQHGTPLVLAFAYHQTLAVKCLVRNGAKVSHSLFKPRDLEISPSNPDFVILQWLFVGRFLERRTISSGAANSTKSIANWAGPCTAEVPLMWEWRMRRAESIWEYACRRQKILSELRGKVVKVNKLVEKDNGSSSRSLIRG